MFTETTHYQPIPKPPARWLRIQSEVYPIERIASLRAMGEDGDEEVWAFDRDGLNLACDETSIRDVQEHATVEDALRAAAQWGQQREGGS